MLAHVCAQVNLNALFSGLGFPLVADIRQPARLNPRTTETKKEVFFQKLPISHRRD
jgi:hypothetical protein